MRGERNRPRRLVALAIPALLLGTVGLSSKAQAGIALDIIHSNGTKLGSIVFPTAIGSSFQDVEFEFTVGGRLFTHGDITAASWELGATLNVLSLILDAVQGDDPCASPAHSPCSNVSLTLTHHSYETLSTQCMFGNCLGAMIVPVDIAFVAAAPAHACLGFEPPLADGPVTVRGNRALPLKAELLDQDDFPLTDADLSAAPVVQVNYHSDVDELPEDVSDQALSAGQGTSGNRFAFADPRWRFNLKVGNYTAPGTYVISMISGDGAEYRVDPTCETRFVVNP